MTQMQLGFRELQEDVRHNKEQEALQSKSLEETRRYQKTKNIGDLVNIGINAAKIGGDLGTKIGSMIMGAYS